MSKEKFIVTADKVRAMFRYEIPYREVVPKGVKNSDVIYETYYIQWEDLEALLSNLKEKNPTRTEFYENWGDPEKYRLFCSFEETVYGEKYYDKPSSGAWLAYSDIGMWPPENQGEAIRCIVKAIRPMYVSDVDIYEPDCHCADYIDFENVWEAIKLFKKGQEVTFPYFWTDNTKAKYISEDLDRYWYLIDSYEDEDVDFDREIIDDLCRKGFPQAVAAKAYCCNGGNRMYDCDFQFVKDSYEWILGLEGYETRPERRCQYANALGCIYYYGYCNGGIPEYEKALKYFIVGAAACHESVYMLADMFYSGQEVEKNIPLARKMISDVYAETREEFLSGHFKTEFADVAYRLGIIYEDEYLNHNNMEDALKAYGYFLEAKLALNMRRYNAENNAEKYGDSELELHIEDELEQLKPICEHKETADMPILSLEPDFFQGLLKDRITGEFKVELLNENEVRISGKRIHRNVPIPRSNNEAVPFDNYFVGQFFVEVPECGLCKTTYEVTYRLKHVKKLWVYKNAKRFKANYLNRIIDGEGDRYEFCRDDECVARIEVDRGADIKWELMYDYRMPIG